MKSQTNELALEIAIEKSLAGICKEDLKTMQVSDPATTYGGNGYFIGNPSDYNKKFAIDEVRFWDFLEKTQLEELEKLKRQPDWKLKILDRLDKLIKKYGVLKVLRKGLAVDDAQFTLFYVYPLQNSSQAIKDNFEKNQFSVTRQLMYSQSNPLEEIDMVLFLNGIPISTIELKNHWTGQNAKVHGINQYKYKRDVSQPLLNFGRCIVHFAVDTDEVYMTTKLDGANTFFLPFNLGNDFGKGNPPNPFGHKTSYLWQDVLTRQSLANIIQHFVRFDGTENEPLSKKTLYFPRYHQLDVVRRLIADAEKKGSGRRYLIQHSAGSGKSNSITWLAYQLIEAYPESTHSANGRSLDAPIFDSVIVVTDRRLLDKQLRENIKEFSQVKNIVAPAYSSKDLQAALENGKRIIVTTIQKFPFIVDGIADMSGRQFAVLVDEAHSGNSGTTADNLNRALGANEDIDSDDWQDKMNEAMKSRKMTPNASYFAFTATPKNTTLEKFGEVQEDGSFKPFHLYSMKQAIEEGFILDVLANYTTYKSYYELEKSIEENPLFDTAKAQKKLRAYVEKHQQTINTKAEIMLDHFMQAVVQPKKLKGKSKAMVVTQSIESAIRYYNALKNLLKEKGSPFKIAIAFSGKKVVDGIEYTEAQINGFPEGETRDKFDEDDYRMLVVANKYLTGFDQPKLTAMYVDKKLQGVLAVQALSRLNRSADKLGKKTEDLFILDFFNSTDDIKQSFDPFYTSTSLSRATDVNVLHEIKDSLDQTGVYEQTEVDDFNAKYFMGVDSQLLSPIIDLAAQRFDKDLELDDKQKADIKIKAKQFVKIYGQIAALLPYEIIGWEKLFWFLKFLIPKLKIQDPDQDKLDKLLESVDLSTYGLERSKLNQSIELDSSESEVDPQKSNMRGAFGGDDERDPLDSIIQSFNERWFQGWEATPEEQRVKFRSLSTSVQAHPDFQNKVADNHDVQNRDLALKKIVDEVMSKQRKQELELYKLYAQDASFYQAFFNTMKQVINVK
ncbi:DEAD/DEAH box helicase family protein [Kaistella sp. PBT33-4]|uniref:type I restriction endonuclease subunit R n=1 Tax=Kaistella sp. PBT33-4 TaxID=3032000 RepID=UPI0023D7E563|nr:DEAD/DEAH box helicase family protein [Kaistella sp. PBT33-4]MDF0718924.1 DEAD/DEAH box helicase family protein [Kaistella sp. PBT33-4]